MTYLRDVGKMCNPEIILHPVGFMLFELFNNIQEHWQGQKDIALPKRRKNAHEIVQGEKSLFFYS